jgi:hypothetical protein
MLLPRLTFAILATTPLWLAGCDQLGLESATTVAARKEAESKAIGAGCRHAARSVEQCYQLNKRADKAAVFAGWKDMNDYMRENKIDAVPEAAMASTTKPAAPLAVAAASDSQTDDRADAKNAKP